MIPSTPTTCSQTNANARTPTSSSQSRGKSPSVGARASGRATHCSSSGDGSSRGRGRIPVARIVAANTEVTALATVDEEEADKSNCANGVGRAKNTTNSDGGDKGGQAEMINNVKGVEVNSGENITNSDSGDKGVGSGEENSGEDLLDSDYNIDTDLDNKDDDEDVNMASATTGEAGSVNLDQFDDVDGYNVKNGPSMNTNPELWIVKGCNALDKIGHRHKNAFYVLLKSYTSKKNYTSILFSKKQYNKIKEFCKYMLDGSNLRKVYLKGNKQAYVWHRRYNVIVSPQAKVIVIRPAQGQVRDAQSLELSALAQPSYIKRAFIDLWKIHKDDHCKGGIIFS
jgi:hypothetical protein